MTIRPLYLTSVVIMIMIALTFSLLLLLYCKQTKNFLLFSILCLSMHRLQELWQCDELTSPHTRSTIVIIIHSRLPPACLRPDQPSPVKVSQCAKRAKEGRSQPKGKEDTAKHLPYSFFFRFLSAGLKIEVVLSNKRRRSAKGFQRSNPTAASMEDMHTCVQPQPHTSA